MKNNEKLGDENGRKVFNLWLDWRDNIDLLTMEERGMFLTMMYDTYQYKSIQPIPEKSIVLRVLWNNAKSILKRGLKDYDMNKDWIESTDFLDRVCEQSTDSLDTVLVQDSTTYTNTTTETSTGTITVTNTNTPKSKRTESLTNKDIEQYYSKLDDEGKKAFVNFTNGMSKSERDEYMNKLILNQ